MHSIPVVDSHTAGEPTRVVISGVPGLGSGSLVDRLRTLSSRHDEFRSAVVNEPRGSDVLVGALLLEPDDERCATAVIFFNNVGYLGMCGHGTIGVVATLAHLGRMQPGTHLIQTPVGIVRATLHPSGSVSVENVASYRHRAAVPVDLPGFGLIHGDIAWGGNWFFLTNSFPCELTLQNRDALTDYTWAIRQALESNAIAGKDGALIDHIELSGPPHTHGMDSRNFVLCPGKAYDRSPCGTGTSAKLACLAANGKLAPGQIWRQEGILGTAFEASYRLLDDSPSHILPTITGSAHIVAEGNLLFSPADPFRTGIRS